MKVKEPDKNKEKVKTIIEALTLLRPPPETSREYKIEPIINKMSWIRPAMYTQPLDLEILTESTFDSKSERMPSLR